MQEITTEFAEYIYDEICTKIQSIPEDDAAEICDCCKMGKYICDNLNKHNREVKHERMG